MHVVAIAALVPVFAVLFSYVVSPPARLLLGILLITLAYRTIGRRFFRQLDDATHAPVRRRPRVWPLAAVLLLAACRQSAPPRAPEPALAEVISLDCGVRVCSVTEAAGARVIWIEE